MTPRQVDGVHCHRREPRAPRGARALTAAGVVDCRSAVMTNAGMFHTVPTSSSGFPPPSFLLGSSSFQRPPTSPLDPSVLHIDCVVSLCEMFLGIDPHFGIWHRYFQFKISTNVRDTCKCGGAAITKKWQEGRSYIPDVKFGDPPHFGIIEAFTLVPPSWRGARNTRG